MADPDYICLVGHGVLSRTASGVWRRVARGFLGLAPLSGAGPNLFSAYCMPGAPKALAFVFHYRSGRLVESGPVALAHPTAQVPQKCRARLRQLVSEPR
jgi:phage terminase small subunit